MAGRRKKWLQARYEIGEDREALLSVARASIAFTPGQGAQGLSILGENTVLQTWFESLVQVAVEEALDGYRGAQSARDLEAKKSELQAQIDAGEDAKRLLDQLLDGEDGSLLV